MNLPSLSSCHPLRRLVCVAGLVALSGLTVACGDDDDDDGVVAGKGANAGKGGCGAPSAGSGGTGGSSGSRGCGGGRPAGSGGGGAGGAMDEDAAIPDDAGEPGSDLDASAT